MNNLVNRGHPKWTIRWLYVIIKKKKGLINIEEEWKYVEGFENKYQISNYGNIRSLYTERNGKRHYRIKNLKWGKITKGYFGIRLCLRGKMVSSPRAHRLVAEAFIPNPNNLPQVNHIDGNKENNCVTNLEWCTNQQNALHSQEHGLNPSFKRLSENFNARCVEQYTLDWNYIRDYECIKEAAIDCGLKNTTRIIDACKNPNHSSGGYRWKYKK